MLYPLFADNPPIVVSMTALILVSIFQCAGAAIIYRLLNRTSCERFWKMWLAWVLWPLCCGWICLLLIGVGLAKAWIFRVLTILFTACGSFVIAAARPRVGATLVLLRKLWRESSWLVKAVLCVGGVYQGAILLLAAQPQRLYDQLAYHLVIAKRIIDSGSPFQHVVDITLKMTGPFEYALAWPRAWIDDDLFTIGAGQFWLTLVAMPATLMLVVPLVQSLSERRLRVAVGAAMTLLLPMTINAADRGFFGIAKPDVFLLIGTLAALIVLATRPHGWRALFVALSLAMMSVKITALHGVLALGPVALAAAWQDRLGGSPARRMRGGWCIVGALVVLLLTVLVKNYLVLGSPLYPGDIRFFAGADADERTMEYWQAIAGRVPSDQLWKKLSGLVFLLGAFPKLLAWLSAAIVLALIAVNSLRHSSNPRDTFRAIAYTALFLVGYQVIWPAFYGPMIYPRFVAPALAGFLFVGLSLTVAAAALRDGQVVALAALLAFSGVGGLDVYWHKLWVHNQSTALVMMRSQVRRIDAAILLNQWSGPDDLIVADDPLKIFFNADILQDKPVAPAENRAWTDLLDNPRRQAREHRLKAIILTKGQAPDAKMINLWQSLLAFGTVVETDSDQILWSRCYFAETPCRG